MNVKNKNKNKTKDCNYAFAPLRADRGLGSIVICRPSVIPEGRGSARLALRVSQLEADPYPGGQDLHILHRSCWPDEFDLVVLRPLTLRDGP